MITRAVLAAAGVLTPDIATRVTLVHGAEEVPIYAALLGAWDGTFAKERKVEWAKRAMDGRTAAINGGGFDNTTTLLTFVSTANLFVNAVIRSDATGEVAIVTVLNSGTQATVVRGWGAADGGVAAANGSVANGVVWRVIGDARGEGAATPAERKNDMTKDYNFDQIFRQNIGITGTADALGTITNHEFLDQKVARTRECLRSIEYAMMRGRRSLTQVGNEMVGTMGGIETYCVTNVDNVGGAMSRARMRTAFAKAWSVGGSPVKWGFAGDTFCAAVDEIFESKLQTRSGETVPGLIVSDVPVRGGLLKLVKAPLMTTGNCVIIDPAVAKLRPMPKEQTTGRDRGILHERTNVQVPGTDGRSDELFSNLTVAWGPEEFHALITGVTGAA